MTRPLIEIERNPEKKIRNLIPTDGSVFGEREHTVFLLPEYRVHTDPYGTEVVDGVRYIYSYSLKIWDYEKSIEAWQAALAANLTPETGRFLEHYLQVYFSQKELKLVHVLAGMDTLDGYPYQVFGYVQDTSIGLEPVTT